MRVMSTLNTVWTWALGALDSTMRLAMMARILDIGTSSPGCGADAGAAGAVGLEATGAAAAGAGAGAVAPPPWMWPRMSVLVMRPEAPVPGTAPRSTLFSE